MASTIIPDPDLGKVLLEQKPTKGIIGNLIFLWLCGLMTLALGVPALVFMPVSTLNLGRDPLHRGWIGPLRVRRDHGVAILDVCIPARTRHL